MSCLKEITTIENSRTIKTIKTIRTIRTIRTIKTAVIHVLVMSQCPLKILITKKRGYRSGNLFFV